DGKGQQNIAQLALGVSRIAAPGSLGPKQIVHTRSHAAVRARADIDEPSRLFDQCSQNVGREHIDGEDAGNAGLNLHSSLAITNAGTVDYGIKATELIDLVGNGPRPGDRGQISGDGSPGTAPRHEGVATSTVVAPMQNYLMALLDQKSGRHETEAVR